MYPLSNKGILEMNELDCMRALVAQGGVAGLTNKSINELNEVDCLRILALRSSSAPSDPLAGIDFALRLQSHNGNAVPLGLYQDVACSIPATMDGDPIAAWRDELGTSGLKAEQASAQAQSMLVTSGGAPESLFDGVDDFSLFSAGITASTTNLFIVAINPLGGANRPLLDNTDRLILYPFSSGGAGQVGWYDGSFKDIAAGVTGWQILTWEFNAGTSTGTVYRNGVSLGSAAYSPLSPDDTVTLCSLVGGGSAFLDASLIGFWVCNDLSKRTVIESYVATLLP